MKRVLEAKPKDPSQAIAGFFHEYDMEELPETHPIHTLKHAYDEFLEGVHVYNDTTYNVYQAEDFFKADVLFRHRFSFFLLSLCFMLKI